MGIPSARLVLGPEFDAALQGIAVADLDGDGRKEVAVADKDRISIYAVQGRAFRRLWSSEGQSWERYNNILALDAADINGNGVAELFVTSFFGNEANSYLLEFQKGEWVRTWQEGGLFFRVMPNSRGEPVLYAQRGGADEAFSGRVNTYAARNGHYEPQSELKLPRGTYIYNFAVGDVRNDGSKQVLQISDEHRLRLFSAGKLRSEPSDRFGGTGVTFDFRPAIFANSLASQSESEFDRLYVHPRLWITDVDGDGTRELVAVRNMATTGRVLKHVVLYDKSKIVALRWGPLGFQILWETPDLEGYISDLFLGDLGDGGEPVLMFALVRPQRLGLVGAHSGLFLYRLARAAGEPQAGRSPEEERVLK